MNYGVLVVGWLVYFLFHSVLASAAVKRIGEATLGTGYRYYRLVYSIISTVGLLAMLMINGSIEAPYYMEPTGWIRYTSFVFTAFGVMLIQVSFRQYKLRSFLGFAPERHGLRRDGVLGWIRHPIYSGLILIIIGFFLFIPNFPTLISCLCMLIYLPLGIWLEERKLVKEYGAAYEEYRKEVPSIIPRWSKIFSN